MSVWRKQTNSPPLLVKAGKDRRFSSFEDHSWKHIPTYKEARWAFGGSRQILQPSKRPPSPFPDCGNYLRKQFTSVDWYFKKPRGLKWLDQIKEGVAVQHLLITTKLCLSREFPATHEGRMRVVSIFCSFFHLFILSHPQSPWVILKRRKIKKETLGCNPTPATSHHLYYYCYSYCHYSSSTTAASHHHYQPLLARGFPSIQAGRDFAAPLMPRSSFSNCLFHTFHWHWEWQRLCS